MTDFIKNERIVRMKKRNRQPSGNKKSNLHFRKKGFILPDFLRHALRCIRKDGALTRFAPVLRSVAPSFLMQRM